MTPSMADEVTRNANSEKWQTRIDQDIAHLQRQSLLFGCYDDGFRCLGVDDDDEHMPGSSIEIVGHSVGGVTCRHDAHRAPLAHKANQYTATIFIVSSIAEGV